MTLDFLHARIRQLEIDLQVCRTNAAHWKAQYETLRRHRPLAHFISFEMDVDATVSLTREATLRFVKPNALAEKLIETVVRDKLFNAVLDQ